MLSGTPVRLGRMAHRPHLNGEHGVVVKTLDESCMYHVSINGYDTLMVRPHNLHPLTVDGFLRLQRTIAQELSYFGLHHCVPSVNMGDTHHVLQMCDVAMPFVLRLDDTGIATLSDARGVVFARLRPIEGSDSADVRIDTECDTCVVHAAPTCTFGFVGGSAWRYSLVYPCCHLLVSEMDNLLEHHWCVAENARAIAHFADGDTADAQYFVDEAFMMTVDRKALSFFWGSEHLRLGVHGLSSPHRLKFLAPPTHAHTLNRRHVLFGEAMLNDEHLHVCSSDGTVAVDDDGRRIKCELLRLSPSTFVLTQIVIGTALAMQILKCNDLDHDAKKSLKALKATLSRTANEETCRLIDLYAEADWLVDSALISRIVRGPESFCAFMSNFETLVLVASILGHDERVYVMVDELEPVATVCQGTTSITFGVAHADPIWTQSAVVRVQAKWPDDCRHTPTTPSTRSKKKKKKRAHSAHSNSFRDLTGLSASYVVSMQPAMARLLTISRADVTTRDKAHSC
jgi:hypothetical protein